MINEETLNELQCASSHEKHFIVEPITLAKCGHSICKSCIPKYVKEIKCCICGLISEQNFDEFKVSKTSQKLLHLCIEDVFKILKVDANSKVAYFKGNFLNSSNSFYN
jgi:hypothetical protein